LILFFWWVLSITRKLIVAKGNYSSIPYFPGCCSISSTAWKSNEGTLVLRQLWSSGYWLNRPLVIDPGVNAFLLPEDSRLLHADGCTFLHVGEVGMHGVPQKTVSDLWVLIHCLILCENFMSAYIKISTIV